MTIIKVVVWNRVITLTILHNIVCQVILCHLAKGRQIIPNYHTTNYNKKVYCKDVFSLIDKYFINIQTSKLIQIGLSCDCCYINLTPFLLSYSFSELIHIFFKISFPSWDAVLTCTSWCFVAWFEKQLKLYSILDDDNQIFTDSVIILSTKRLQITIKIIMQQSSHKAV